MGEERWRSDGKCGLLYLLSDGSPAECDPLSDTPCCAAMGRCTDVQYQCETAGSIDYRDVLRWRQAGQSFCLS